MGRITQKVFSNPAEVLYRKIRWCELNPVFSTSVKIGKVPTGGSVIGAVEKLKEAEWVLNCFVEDPGTRTCRERPSREHQQKSSTSSPLDDANF